MEFSIVRVWFLEARQPKVPKDLKTVNDALS